MKICQTHWEQLKQAIKAKGLFDFVSGTGKEAMTRIVGQLQGQSETKQNFDPLMACNNMLWGNALQVGGLYLMGTDEQGNEYCPVCEADKHGQTGWIDCAVNSAAEYVKTLPDT